MVLFERRPEWRGFPNRDSTLWAHSYNMSTVGLNKTAIRKYIQNQEEGSKIE